MVLGHELFRYHRILNTRADLVADKLGEVFVGLPARHYVVEIAQPFFEPGLRPQLLIQREPLFPRDLEGVARVEVVGKAGRGFANSLVNFRVGRLEPALGLRVDRPIPQRRAVIRRALEDREMADFFGDYRDELDGGGARTDDRDALAAEVRLFLRPFAGVIRDALEALNPLKRRRIIGGQDADRRDEKLCARPLSVVDLDFPAMLLLVVDRRGDSGMELDVAAQVELVRDVIEVTLVLRLTGKMLLPVPFLQQFLRERISVGFTLGIEAAARVAVPIPGAAHAAAILVEPHREAELAQAVHLIQAGNPGADDNRV